MSLQAGEVLHDRYRVVKLLAQGGFGTLYRVWDTSLGRPCALKENLDASAGAQRQFLREAKLLANLNHPNLPRVTDHFVLPGQGQYLVMDYVEGQDLQEMLDDRGTPLPESQVLPWIGQVCDALSYLHAQTPAVIHRDIKPANIKITPNGQAMLVDFGIAKVYEPQLKTTVGAQAVTPGYSPYEQYGKGTTDARSDIYALGATVYTLLTGVEPPESLQRVVRDPLTTPRQLNPNLNMRVSAALMRAMQIDPLQRFQSAAEFKAALLPPAPRPAPLPAPRPTPPVSPLPLHQAALPWGWVGLVGLLLLVILTLIAILLNQEARTHPILIQTVAVASQLSASPSPGLSPSPVFTAATPTLSFTTTPTAVLTPLAYTVQSGETCSGIAQAFGTSIESIVTLNQLSPDCLLYVGQVLWVPWDGQLPARPSPTPPQPLTTLIAAADGMQLVYIPAGDFLMGSAETDAEASAAEQPAHRVYVSAFWIDRSEVTNAMYARCVQDGVCQPPEKNVSKQRSAYYDEPKYADFPVIYVSWQDASNYCRWAGRRLPREAEWEKAARGTHSYLYPWGVQEPYLGRANFGNQVGDTDRVGNYPDGASPYGVWDLAGNVSEWVADWYDEAYYAGATYKNPSGPQNGEFRVLRGGSWFSQARTLRAAFRLWNYPDLRSDSIGFRCAK